MRKLDPGRFDATITDNKPKCAYNRDELDRTNPETADLVEVRRDRMRVEQAQRDYWTKKVWIPRNKEKVRANAKLNHAIRTGRIKKGACAFAQFGGCRGPIEGHHMDYRRPLDVIWCCSKHHHSVFTSKKRGLNAKKKRL